MRRAHRWLLALQCLGSAAVAQQPARETILKAFDTRTAVLLGEVHYSVAEHRFLQELLHDPRLPGTVTDIAVEFGNARYQPMLDQYIAGVEVPADSLRQVWQNTMVPLAWDFTLYRDIFRTIRDLNRTLPPEKRLRVLALDPPIGWEAVHSVADIPRRWGYRDPMWYEVLEREVFAKQRKVLVICGGVHVMRRDASTNFKPVALDRAGLGEALEQTHPGASYAIYPLLGTSGIARLVSNWPPSAMADVKGTTLGARSSHQLLPGNITIFTMVDGKRVPRQLVESDYPPIESVVDAIVWFGRDASLAPTDLAPFRDSTYVAELHRRSAIVQPIFGQDLDPQIDQLVRRALRKRPE